MRSLDEAENHALFLRSMRTLRDPSQHRRVKDWAHHPWLARDNRIGFR